MHGNVFKTFVYSPSDTDPAVDVPLTAAWVVTMVPAVVELTPV